MWLDRFKSPFRRTFTAPVTTPMPIKIPGARVTPSLKDRRRDAEFLNLTHDVSDDSFQVMWEDGYGRYIETVAREALSSGFLCDFSPDFVMQFTIARLGLPTNNNGSGWFTFAPGQVVMRGNIGSITSNTTGRLIVPSGTNQQQSVMPKSSNKRKNIEGWLKKGEKVVLVMPSNGSGNNWPIDDNHPYFPKFTDSNGSPIVGEICDCGHDYQGDEFYAVRIRWPRGNRSEILKYRYETPDKDRECFTLAEWQAMQNSKLADELVDIKTEELDKVILPHEGKRSILAVIKQHQHRKKIFEEWGLGSVMEYGRGMTMLFWGPPGTGKTWASQCIAKAMGKKLNILDNAKLQSSVPGEMERNLKAEFAEASRTKAILMLDECDSLLMKRDGMGMILSSEINCLLTEIEKFEGMVILTTNRVGELDKALERRISLVVNFPAPDLEQRVQIWKRFLPEKLPIGADVTAEKLAEVELTGGLIKNVVLNAARLAVSEDCEKVELTHFERAVCMSEDGNKAFRKKSKVLHGTVDPSPQMGGGAVSLVKRMQEELGMDEEKVEEVVAAGPDDSKKKEADQS